MSCVTATTVETMINHDPQEIVSTQIFCPDTYGGMQEVWSNSPSSSSGYENFWWLDHLFPHVADNFRELLNQISIMMIWY